MTPEQAEDLRSFVSGGQTSLHEACLMFEGALDGVAGAIRGSSRASQLAPPEAEAELDRRARSIRESFRRKLILSLPADRGADRPAVEELSGIFPDRAVRFPAYQVTLGTGRLMVLGGLGALAGVLIAIAVGGLLPSTDHAVASVGITVAATALSIFLGAAPLSRRQRVLLAGGGVLSIGALGLVVVLGGFRRIVGALSPTRRWYAGIAVAAIAAVVLLRLWVRRPTVDQASVESARNLCRSIYRESLETDLSALALWKVLRERETVVADHDRSLRATLGLVQTEVATALRRPNADARESLARCADLLSIADTDPRSIEPPVFRWEGSAGDRERWRTIGLVKPGDRVRVTRRPVIENSADGTSRVVERGEVAPEI